MNDLQRYVSPDLTHFVGRKKRTLKEKYDVLHAVLESRVLKANRPTGFEAVPYVLQIRTTAKLSDNQAYLDSVVCFCDIPLADLGIHIQKYGRFGLAFAKELLLERGATPVMYIPQKARPSLVPFKDFHRKRNVATTARAFDEFFKRYQRLASECREWETSNSSTPPLKQLARQFRDLTQFMDTNVFSHLKFFDPLKADWDKNNYYMEREWRVKGNVRFRLSDVYRIIIPESYSRRFRKDFPAYDGEIVFAD